MVSLHAPTHLSLFCRKVNNEKSMFFPFCLHAHDEIISSQFYWCQWTFPNKSWYTLSQFDHMLASLA